MPGFPNTITCIRVLSELLRVRRERQGAENYFFRNAGALEVVEYFIERVVHAGRLAYVDPMTSPLVSRFATEHPRLYPPLLGGFPPLAHCCFPLGTKHPVA